MSALEAFFASPPPRDLTSPAVRSYRQSSAWGPRIPVLLGTVLSVSVAAGVGEDAAQVVGGAIGLGVVLVLPFVVLARRVRSRADRMLRETPTISLTVVAMDDREVNDEGQTRLFADVWLHALPPSQERFLLSVPRDELSLEFAPGTVMTGLGPTGSGALVAMGERVVTAARIRPPA